MSSFPILSNFTHYVLAASDKSLGSNIAVMKKTTATYKNKKESKKVIKKKSTENIFISLIELIKNQYDKIQNQEELYGNKKKKYYELVKKHSQLKEKIDEQIKTIKSSNKIKQEQAKAILKETHLTNFKGL
jgi:SPX domain protein involved in polyphosphate accumulation